MSPTSLKLSLDPPIQSLADATFELLRAQYWFDAILIVDDSVVSDLFARRMSSLCRNNGNGNNGYETMSGGSPGHHSFKRRQTPDESRRVDSNLYGDGWAWSNFKKSSLRKSQFRIDVLNGEEEEVDATSFSADDPRRSVSSDDIYEVRRSKEASLLDVWKNLIVIRLSRSLAQTEVRFRGCHARTCSNAFCHPLVLPANGSNSDHTPKGSAGAHRLGHHPARYRHCPRVGPI